MSGTTHFQQSIRKMVRYQNHIYIIDSRLLQRVDARTGILDASYSHLASSDIQDMIIANDKLVIGGQFEEVSGQARKHIAIFDAATGALTSTAPQAEFTVYALLAEGNDVYFSVMDTTSINGLNNTGQSIKRFNLATGIIAGWKTQNSGANSDRIEAIAIWGNYVYSGGEFSALRAGTTGNYRSLARYDKSTGTLDAGWQPLAGLTLPSTVGVRAMLVHNNNLYIGGNFSTVFSETRLGIAALNINGGLTNFNVNGLPCHVRTFYGNGNSLWVGGNFAFLAGFNRYRIVEIDLPSSQATCWNATPVTTNFTFVESIVVSNDTVFVGADLAATNNSHFKVFTGLTVPNPPVISGPDTVYVNESDTFSVATITGQSPFWLYTRAPFTFTGGSSGPVLIESWPQMGIETVSAYYRDSENCYSDTVSKNIIVTGHPSTITTTYNFSQASSSYPDYTQVEFLITTNNSPPYQINLELSDTSGSFANPTILESFINFNQSGILSADLCNLPPGNKYRLRYTTTSPGSYTYIVNGPDINISPWNFSIARTPSVFYDNSICAGQSIDLSAPGAPSSMGGPISYRWLVNGQQVATTPTYTTTSTLTDQDTIYFETNIEGCITLSYPFVVAVNQPLPTTVQINSAFNGTTACPGIPDTFRITNITNVSAIAPDVRYRWLVNGIFRGSTQSQTQPFIFTPNDGDTITLNVRRLDGCFQQGQYDVFSNPIIYRAHPKLTASFIVTTPRPVCPGTPIDVVAVTTNGSPNTMYQWKLNNINTGPNSPNFTIPGLPLGNTFISLQATGSLHCPNETVTTGTLGIFASNELRTTLFDTLCFGDNYHGYTTTGTYIDTFIATGGCDSIRTLNLIVRPDVSNITTQVICYGSSYLGYTQTGVYTDTFTAASGCDSIIGLNLTVLNEIVTTLNETICPGDNFLGYTQTGVYNDTFTSANGCDSVRVLNLNVSSLVTTVNQSICQGSSYLGYTQTGVYNDTFVSAFGCDSIRVLNLTLAPAVFSIANQTICQGNNYQGYTLTGTYVDTLVASGGCDSIATLNLTVLPALQTTIDTSILPGQAVDGYTASGTYIDTLSTNDACDSIRTLILEVLPVGDVWPGDANSDGIADNYDVLNIGLGYNTSGPVRTNASNVWVAQSSQLWAPSFANGVNYHHADCNGDGVIDSLDIDVVVLNYGLTHLKTKESQRAGNPPLSLQFTVDTAYAPTLVTAEVLLGDALNPVTNGYGIAFTVHFNNNLVDSAGISANFTGSWLGNGGNPQSLAKNLFGASKIDIAHTRTTQTSISGHGRIATLSFYIQDNIIGKDFAAYNFILDVTGSLLISNDETEIPVDEIGDTVVILDEYTNIVETNLPEVSIYPNPGTGLFHITVSTDAVVTIYDVFGKLILTKEMPNHQAGAILVDLANQPNGVYLVKIMGSKGTVNKRLVKQ